ncbi:MAG: mechanosensitive ion channel family protein [Desulfarculus sp.]|nr:mechanosensitive ion channel family protein [Pseudomonadota bacterium]MBV1715175.1 mechanosensitive ion channel family protein [Desulfarculus sp.]MBU4573613.1 mechanosensitive ion channel family protein [Pseudomonadota bacterium]MBU4598277.1 mechanosensitive ion channel family protein [Pseudomonadota bacterium]MBV1736673.1 mechanosensitive ion channel family protein [Desulfarculus sp.]
MDWDWLQAKNLLDPSTGLGMIALAVVLYIAASLISRLLGQLLKRSGWVMGHLGRRVDPTVVAFTLRLKTVLVYLGSVVIYASLVPQLRGLFGTLVAGAGITAVVVGFAAKGTLANLVAGFSLAVYRPIRIGDKVTLDDQFGTVEDITLRHTIVRTWENKRIIIPNEKIDSMTLTNHTIIDPKILCRVEMGVSYDTKIDLARRLILAEAQNCPHRMPASTAPEQPWVRVISHGDFSIGLRLLMWCPNMDEAWAARWWILEAVKKRFDAEGVEIPFPYRTLVYKKDLPPPRPDAGDGGEKTG